MSNTTTDQPEPDQPDLGSAKDFDIEAWLNGARLPERSVEIYQRPDLLATINELDAELERTPAEEESLGGERAALEEKYNEVAAQIAASRTVFRVRALTGDQITRFDKKHPKIDPENRMAHLLAMAIVAPAPMSFEQVQRLRAVIGDAQYARLWVAFREATDTAPVVPAPFSPKRSPRPETR